MFKVLYEDDNFIAVEKEQGFVCVPDPGDADSLLEAVKREVSPSAELCHRLDRNTGGIVLFAKNPQALADAEQAMKDGEISKTYTAVLAGRPAGLFGDGKTFKTLKAFHFKDAKKGTVYIYDTPRKLAREIITKVKPLSYDPVSDTTLCDIMLVTGRTHQIRAHMAHLGHPVAGDGKYGRNAINKKLPYRYQALWAREMKFTGKFEKKYALPAKISSKPEFK
ncbi:MAG: RluA family pseudouridine synthase [Clostridia bacterium]|nr:RluA family pseudouridine synthase [Clostridia bacterium]MBO7659477.1 RluA family pseudouridine synthase [Clostridia bacterium]MBP5666412.1 RluA family pseudouridine synthase [Clostridia bacterium]MBP5766512.1 RluA family pseudouridine synthase [Clostridia bacterium]